MRVGLFVTCLVDLMRPSIGFAAIGLLEAAGYEVHVPPAQTCCGQPGYNSGDRASARALAAKLLDEFDACEYVVAPSGSCAGMIRIHYPDLFRDDAYMLGRIERLCARVYELTDFLVSVAGLAAVPGRHAGTVTYHDACSGLRELGVKHQPRVLLGRVPGLVLREMDECEQCCGFGGTFAVKFGDVSAAIADRKCAAIEASGAGTVVLGDLGCMLNIEGRLRRRGNETVKVLHVAEVLGGCACPRESLMQVHSMHFKARAGSALGDEVLQANLRKFGASGFALSRAKVVEAYGAAEFERLRNAGAAIRDRALATLDAYIERFEREATRRGATVLFAETGAQACDLVLEICRRHGLKKAIKSKSMLSEEAGLNEALAAAGVEPVETDLGEYIIQLAGEAPSHIIAPAVHKSKDQVADLFAAHHRQPRKTDIGEMTREARAVLRGHFVSADLGISGGNFLIAETGSGLVVTNEGNGRMVTTLPRVHVCITGIEKVIPTLEDFSALLRLLTRSATGQPISNYVSVFTGPRRGEDRDGPEHMYFILVDAGRTNLVGGDMQEMLRCIRCGACMNHCPVYKTVGGHAYGWVYPGPMGAVLTPSYVGLENALDLPHAATLCNQCGVVCPVRIPLPELLRKLREKEVEQRLRPKREMLALRLWGWVAERPRLYAFATRWAGRALRILGGGSGRIRRLPFGSGWTRERDLPAPRGATFRDLYRKTRA